MSAAQYEKPLPPTTIPEGVSPLVEVPPYQSGAGTNLPDTGADPWELVVLALGLMLVAVGLLILASTKRRPRRAGT